MFGCRCTVEFRVIINRVENSRGIRNLFACVCCTFSQHAHKISEPKYICKCCRGERNVQLAYARKLHVKRLVCARSYGTCVFVSIQFMDGLANDKYQIPHQPRSHRKTNSLHLLFRQHLKQIESKQITLTGRPLQLPPRQHVYV